MKVRVRAFAALREALGFGEQVVTLPDGATVADLLDLLTGEHPAAGLSDRRYAVAVNRAFAERTTALAEGDEVALIPPVSGGSGAATGSGTATGRRKPFEIVTGPISLDDVAARVLAPERGGVTVFAGTVRGVTGSLHTDYLEYEAYAEMAEPAFAAIAAEAQARWPDISAVAVVHRVGRLEVGDVSIAIAVAAAHRANTFDACRFIIDRIKQSAPIWKREVGPDGSSWVEGPESTV